MQTMQKTLKCEGRSMKWLHMHIRSIHQIEVLKRKITNETNMKLSKQPNISAVRTLDYYINDTSLPAILARMTACDGPSFNVFTTSLDIRRSISALGHSIPKSVSGVRDQIVKYGQQLREEVKRSIHIPKSKDDEFALITSIVDALNPIKMAVEALCRRDTNLITAEATIKSLPDDIYKTKSHFHKQILESINQRIVEERYTDASVTLQYPHNPSIKLEKKSIVVIFCANLLLRTRREDKEFPISEDGITESP
ncbi:hypothetical protein LOD99_6232 [Oopsacas minuta]|uniref:Uncharacterized protein n=1 Tax=Oopsacas minuta TaxID=111878 RepID=A0AAV7JMS8_9METZ|nr:hypothetical protein LOD99_6232 [Oopsacas minuta]